MRKVIFLDRDGIINEEVGDYIMRFENFTILPDLMAGLKQLNLLGFEFVVITNQGGLAKGLYDLAELQKMHSQLQNEMADHAMSFLDIYYCHHHPDYNGKCLCRKPGSVMVEKAIARFDIDPSQSFFVGDKQRDIQAGEACGVKGILVKENTSMIEIAAMIQAHLSH